MSNLPLVSVIMSVYNGENHLKEAIRSILNQTFQNFEFIIVNDCSTDRTSDVLEYFCQNDRRIKIVNNDRNIGLTGSLNKALACVQGRYVARMDADDISYRERLAEQVGFLSNNSQCGLVGTWAHKIDDGGKIIRHLKFPTDNRNIKRALIKKNTFIHSSIMVRSKVFKKVGGYNSAWSFAQDYEFFFRVVEYYEINNIPKPLIAHRCGVDTLSYKKNKQQTLFAIRARQKSIAEGQYKKTAYIYFVRPIFAYIVPKWIKYPFLFLRRR